MPAGRKLGQRWMGPFEVVKRVGAVAYRLRLPATLQVHPVFHVSLLRAYHASGEHRRTLPPDPILVAGAPEHVVARVLSHRCRGLQYLVEWEGYDVADATWEPERHLENAPTKVAEYWDRLGTCHAGWLSAPKDASELASSDESSVAPDPQPSLRWKRVLLPCQDD